MGGSLDCESEPGKGSKFFFDMRIEAVHQNDRRVLHPDAAQLTGIRVLIIDDNATNREILERQTASWKIINDSASSGPEGLAKLRSAQQNGQPFDLVILDMQMPEMDGYQATANIRSLEDEKEGENYTPNIALTANALEGDREKCLIAGMDDYLSKPFKQDEIRKKIEKWAAVASNLFPEDEAETSAQLSEKKEASSPIDRIVLDALRELQIDGEPDIIKKITDAYLRSSEPLVTNLRQSVIDKNYE